MIKDNQSGDCKNRNSHIEEMAKIIRNACSETSVDECREFEGDCSLCRATLLYNAGYCRRIKANFFTPEEVRKMSPREVKENYTAIMESIKEWK